MENQNLGRKSKLRLGELNLTVHLIAVDILIDEVHTRTMDALQTPRKCCLESEDSRREDRNGQMKIISNQVKSSRNIPRSDYHSVEVQSFRVNRL